MQKRCPKISRVTGKDRAAQINLCYEVAGFVSETPISRIKVADCS